MKSLYTFIFIAASLVCCQQSLAASPNTDSTYRFTGNGFWHLATNWANQSMPPAVLPGGASIIIDPAGSGECVLDVAQTIGSHADLIVMPGKRFRILGDLVLRVTSELLLKSYVMLDTLHIPTRDTMEKEEYAYDSQQRLTSWKTTSYDSTEGKIDYVYDNTFYYRNSDSIPYYSTTTNSSYYNGQVYNSYNSECSYQYDSSGRLSYSRGINYAGDSLEAFYSYFGDTSICFYIEYYAGSITAYDTTILISNNVLQNGNYLSDSSSFKSNFFTNINLFAATYDNHPNPLRKMQLYKQLIEASPRGYINYLAVEASANNALISDTGYELGIYSDMFIKNYVYNSAGYPLIARYKENYYQGEIIRAGKYLFEYY